VGGFLKWYEIASILISIFALVIAFLSTIERFSIASSHRKERLDWYSETIYLLITLRLYCKENASRTEKLPYLAKLSSQIEIGRFYFPSIQAHNKSIGKFQSLSAYSGIRNGILSLLVHSYDTFYENTVDISKAEILQKQFTSEVYSILTPRVFWKKSFKITRMRFVNNITFQQVKEHMNF